MLEAPQRLSLTGRLLTENIGVKPFKNSALDCKNLYIGVTNFQIFKLILSTECLLFIFFASLLVVGILAISGVRIAFGLGCICCTSRVGTHSKCRRTLWKIRVHGASLSATFIPYCRQNVSTIIKNRLTSK